MKAVIMAGGKGTRLRSIAKDIPKPMISILGKPILEYQIESLKRSGITEIILVVGHLQESIQEYFGDGNKFGVSIDYIKEDMPLGTAGSFYYLNGKIIEDFVLVFGDLIFDVDFNRFMSFHMEKKGLISLYGHPNSHPYDSDIIVTDEKCCVTRFLSKTEERDFYYHNFTNAGLYCISSKVLEFVTDLKKMDLDSQIINKLVEKGEVFAYKSTEYVKDMGTPERLEAVEKDIRDGIVSLRCLKNKQKAVFLDRDGTINKLVGFLKNSEKWELLPNVTEAIKRINNSEYLAIVVTNQPVVARGECTIEELDNIHKRMETELGEDGAYVDAVFYCPHHPDRGFDGEITELKINCDCRKPKSGMIEKAKEQYNIDLNNSWFIGDSTVDIQTGINAGTKTLLLHTGEGGKDGKYEVIADAEARNLLEAVNMILEYTDNE